ncbi:MAG: hypothetical protein HQ526_12050 [Actinobacteria bacterium]|nr:hypothetical protein [Actinomycetota bacterium]
MDGRTLGMKLAGIGAANAAAGLGMWRFGRGDGIRAFGQQTAMWGLVDLGIAGVSLLRPAGDPARIRKVLLINAALDVGYIAGGACVAYCQPSFGGRITEEAASGHGVAVVVQGTQLLVFDLWNARQLETDTSRAAAD